MSLKLIQLNIEFDRHYDRWIPLVQKEQPDVVCLQEVYASDVDMLTEQLGMVSQYEPMTRRFGDQGTEQLIGIALFSRQPLVDVRRDYYYGSPKTIPEFGALEPCKNKILLSGKYEKDGQYFTIGNDALYLGKFR